MDDKTYRVTFIIVALLVYSMYRIQETNKRCKKVFVYPKSSLVTNWLPGFNSENKTENMDPLNDLVNKQYLSSPLYEEQDGVNGITKGLWSSTRSQAEVSNNGQLNESFIFDQITPEYLNQNASKGNELMTAGGSKSRVLDFHGEGENFENPWS